MTFCPRPTPHLIALALLSGAATLPAQAASTAASSASDSASSAASSASNSIGKSSNSSSPGNDVADGDYRVIDMADATDRPGVVRLTLQGVVGAATVGKPEFELYLPRATLEQAQLATGQQIRTRQRPYGIEFARADAQAPFFLALRDEWYRELASHPVTL
ncbi:hypothetical protein [Sphaerotilus sp.]|jgi:hypothetical protein|uniref:hypothetical protein n=1 Tax=Sphaerotilus sp. TaxID=2093942 RepID=UPI00286E5598|nr:hypothetical protein [Sphaerotilus sp.]